MKLSIASITHFLNLSAFVIGLIAICLPGSFALASSPDVAVERLENGLSQLTSKHLILVTDLPVVDEIKDLCSIFDKAMPQWGEEFGIATESWKDARAQICLMVDRQRFIDLKYITPEIPPFREGYQFQDRLFMLEQPSAYYRRHLMLHEGTHWFLWKFVGGNGPPWFSEGMCEMLSTHLYTDPLGKLEMNWIPTSRESVPYWGRLKLIRESIAADKAPSIGRIMQYSDTAHLTDEPYAWSWAAVLFFSRNPRFKEVLRQTFVPNLRSHIGSEHALSQDLKDSLRSQWSDIEAEWTAFVNDLDYGFSTEHSMETIHVNEQVSLTEETSTNIQSNRGWQATGVRVKKGDNIFVSASGRVVVRDNSRGPAEENTRPRDWDCEPQGITLKYYNGAPMGKLIAAIVPIHNSTEDASGTEKIIPVPIGRKHSWVASQSGILLMKLNEPSSELHDNSGAFRVTISGKEIAAISGTSQ